MMALSPIDSVSVLSAGLASGAQALGVSLSEAQQGQLLGYLALLQKWNQTYNLTAIRDPQKMLGLHVLDSLAVVPHLRAGHWLDIGSGPGLPGIVLAIARPDLVVTMIDSVQKKTTFIRHAVAELTLKNAEVVCHRVEQYQPPQLFDGAISRAFADLNAFISAATHLVTKDGEFMAMKGVQPDEEIAALPAGFCIAQVIPLKVPQVEGQRHLVQVKRG